MSRWELVARNVMFTHQLPEYDSFVGDSYQCTNCRNRLAVRTGRTDLPKVCPWCGNEQADDFCSYGEREGE